MRTRICFAEGRPPVPKTPRSPASQSPASQSAASQSPQDYVFDYVIVGAGSAGCVLAERLTERPGVTVAVLEAGTGAGHPAVTVPAAYPLLFGTARDWDHRTNPQPG